MSPLLVDLAGLRASTVDDALDLLAKAESEGGGDIWAPHPNPLVRRIVEVFSSRGLQRSKALTDELGRWLNGDRPQLSTAVPPTRPDEAMLRWTPDELRLVRTYLEALRPAEFMLDDWLLLVDWLVQRYLPLTDLRSEADWLATRAGFMGRIQAALGDVGADDADLILTHLPPPPEAAKLVPPTTQAAIAFGRARACEAVTAISDQTRHRLRSIVTDHVEAQLTGAPFGGSLESKLRDAEGALNRDWRRVAVTEATELAGQGFIAAQSPGTRVRRVEQYRGACSFCRGIDGSVLTVVAADDPKKDGEKDVWPGKSNRGRSGAARRRGEGGLIDRDPGERWWVPAGAAHPNCRGRWVLVGAVPADPTFEAWLASLKPSPVVVGGRS